MSGYKECPHSSPRPIKARKWTSSSSHSVLMCLLHIFNSLCSNEKYRVESIAACARWANYYTYLCSLIVSFLVFFFLVNETLKTFIEIAYIIYGISCKRNQGEQSGENSNGILTEFHGLIPHLSTYKQSIYNNRKKEKLHPELFPPKLI